MGRPWHSSGGTHDARLFVGVVSSMLCYVCRSKQPRQQCVESAAAFCLITVIHTSVPAPCSSSAIFFTRSGWGLLQNYRSQRGRAQLLGIGRDRTERNEENARLMLMEFDGNASSNDSLYFGH